MNLALGGLVFLLGLLILRENPRQRLNRVVASMLFFGGLGSLLAGLEFLQGPGRDELSGALPAPNSVRNLAYVWEFFFPTLFLFASVFPEERGFARRGAGLQRWIPFAPGFGTLVYLPHAFHFTLLLVLAIARPSFEVPGGPLRMLAPLASAAGLVLQLFLAVHQALFSLVNLGFGVAAVVLLADSTRRARAPRLRQQLRVIGIGLTACLVLYSLSSLIPTILNFSLPGWVRSALTAGALTVGSGAIAYSIVRYKFLDLKLLARRGILYGVTSAAVVGIYLTLVAQVNRLLTTFSSVDARVIEPVFLIVALILFQPALSRLEELLDRTLLRDPGDYRNVLRNLGRELLSTIELEALLTRSIGTIADALLLRRAVVVALARDRVIVEAGAGAPLTAEEAERVRSILGALPAVEESFRLADLTVRLAPADQALLVDRLGVALIVPLRTRGETVGALLLGEKLTGTEYTSEDVVLLTTLAGQMAVSLQNALLVRERVEVVRFEEELRLARQIQRSFLMSQFPAMARFEVHALNIPSKEVGGDFYDLVPCGDGGFVVAIADVAGKGVPAALLSSMLQASLRTQAASIPSVAEILRNINSLVYRGTAVHQFATFFIARVENDTLRMTFSNAGHNYPVVARRNGDQLTLERGGIVLGIMEGAAYEEEDVRLEAGDRVLFYTDGITEAVNGAGEQFGEDRLCEVLRGLPEEMPANAVAEQILDALRSFLGAEEPRDDMTLMVLRVTEPDPAPLSPGRLEELEHAGAATLPAR
jgi:sigma-B regulation protein RsbU (phosphoserine phosphatase)